MLKVYLGWSRYRVTIRFEPYKGSAKGEDFLAIFEKMVRVVETEREKFRGFSGKLLMPMDGREY